MKYLTIIMLSSSLTTTCIYSQELTFKDLEGIRFYDKESIYAIFTAEGAYHYFSIYSGNIVYHHAAYGFFDNCTPTNVKDLKSKGTGDYFFIVDDRVLESDGKIIPPRLNCWSVEIDHERESAYYEPDSLYLHFGRKAIIHYKKMQRLPDPLISYLQKEQPEAYMVYLNISKSREN